MPKENKKPNLEFTSIINESLTKAQAWDSMTADLTTMLSQTETGNDRLAKMVLNVMSIHLTTAKNANKKGAH